MRCLLLKTQPPPPPRLRSKMDSLIFLPDSTKPVKVEETAAAFTDSLSVPPPGSEDITSKEATGEFQNDVEVENVERPVGLYRASSGYLSWAINTL
ncbi:G patch domain-containing protein TGH-like [Rhododendron vialii]|uniref:G patch domain-containing protein TGH-like n=1 Tax=Rhododendron vialii TaxID=182163 RepID=UPI00265FC2EC|nr:G patch domain-containing protein TGH-like [Rhododendron vialii]